MAKETKKSGASQNGKRTFGESNNKRTSIGKSANSRPKNKRAVRERKGH